MLIIDKPIVDENLQEIDSEYVEFVTTSFLEGTVEGVKIVVDSPEMVPTAVFFALRPGSLEREATVHSFPGSSHLIGYLYTSGVFNKIKVV